MRDRQNVKEQKEKLPVTDLTRLRRFPIRGSFERETIYSILDKAPLAHIGFGSPPSVLPMVFFRRDDHVYFHGAQKNRMFGELSKGTPCCFVATLLDAFVAARAALHHSVNYRSVVIYGEAEDVDEPGAKLEALKCLIERFYPGRWKEIRPPSPQEFAMVRIFRLPIQQASAKIRTGFPTPYPEDFGMPVWAGVVPVNVTLGEPLLDPNCAADTPPYDFSHLKGVIEKG